LPVGTRVALEFAKILFAWPTLVALVFVYFALSKLAPYKLARVLRPFRSLKLFGTEFVLSDEVGTDAEQAIEIYRKRVKRQFDTLVGNYAVREKLESVIDDVQGKVPKIKQVTDIRWTLHVPDILFADTLYQLVDYYPRGGGRSRVFSFRFGVIGLCWRSKAPVIRGEVPTGKPQKLLVDWGMTEEEAKASGSGKQSFVSIPLQDESKTHVGIFYMDSKQTKAFGDDASGEATLVKVISDACADQGLTKALSKINDDLKDKRPSIRVHEQ
jgi:hypothetical protein